MLVLGNWILTADSFWNFKWLSSSDPLSRNPIFLVKFSICSLLQVFVGVASSVTFWYCSGVEGWYLRSSLLWSLAFQNMDAVDTSEGGTSIDSGMTNSKYPVRKRDFSSSDMFSRVSPYTMKECITGYNKKCIMSRRTEGVEEGSTQ